MALACVGGLLGLLLRCSIVESTGNVRKGAKKAPAHPDGWNSRVGCAFGGVYGWEAGVIQRRICRAKGQDGKENMEIR